MQSQAPIRLVGKLPSPPDSCTRSGLRAGSEASWSHVFMPRLLSSSGDSRKPFLLGKKGKKHLCSSLTQQPVLSHSYSSPLLSPLLPPPPLTAALTSSPHPHLSSPSQAQEAFGSGSLSNERIHLTLHWHFTPWKRAERGGLGAFSGFTLLLLPSQ